MLSPSVPLSLRFFFFFVQSNYLVFANGLFPYLKVRNLKIVLLCVHSIGIFFSKTQKYNDL